MEAPRRGVGTTGWVKFETRLAVPSGDAEQPSWMHEAVRGERAGPETGAWQLSAMQAARLGSERRQRGASAL